MNPTATEINRLLTRCLERLEQHPETTSPGRAPAQNALLAYLRMDKIVEDHGFAALIAQGYGREILLGGTAEHLHHWQIPVTPKLMDEARELYLAHGRDIEAQAAAGINEETLRQAFPQFAPLDEAYFMNCEEDFPLVYNHVRRHYADFAGLLED